MSRGTGSVLCLHGNNTVSTGSDLSSASSPSADGGTVLENPLSMVDAAFLFTRRTDLIDGDIALDIRVIILIHQLLVVTI